MGKGIKQQKTGKQCPIIIYNSQNTVPKMELKTRDVSLRTSTDDRKYQSQKTF